VGAIQAILEGQRNVMVGIKNDEVVYVPFSNAIKSDKPVKKELIDVLALLSI
ncbi:MAG: 6-phosphofructokinase, partial [Paraprevotella sp.]|nr:6-phosphofructokinase [Paraprevotella sp.]